MTKMKLKAKLLRLLTGLSNEIARRRHRIEEAKKLISKQKVIKEDFEKMYNELETLQEFTKHINRWFKETAEKIKKETGVE
ncbi:MAG: hypothetical protein DRP25_03035 [Thermotoga sp.]|nr:MAG: hypothetical protein DRP25_03035 [Thermotoga sp.]